MSPPPHYSSPLENQYYLVVTLKWKITQGVPLSHLPSDSQPPPPPPPNKSKKSQDQPRDPRGNWQKKEKEKKGNYLCESSLGRFTCWRAFLKNFLWLSLGRNQYRREGLWFVCLLYDGSTRRLTESGFMWFYGFMVKLGIEPATPGVQGIALIHYTTGASQICGFPWVETSTAGRVYDLCVYYMTGAPEGSPKVVLCVFLWFYGEAGNRTCDPWFTRHSAYPLHHGGFS